jgi:HEXXH motif-containing protein
MSTATPHRLSPAAFTELAAGRGGRAAVAELLSVQDSKHRLLLRGVLAAAERSGGDHAALARKAFDVLAESHQRDAQAAETVIRYPAVAAWALRAVRRARDGGSGPPGTGPDGLAAVAAAAAIRAGLTADIEVRASRATVMLPSLGAARVAAGTATIRTRDGAAQVIEGAARVAVPSTPGQDGPGWQALRRITAGQFDVILDDLDPFRMPAAPGLAGRLSEADLCTWDRMFQGAWRRLAESCPRMSEEVALVTKTVVPRSRPPKGMVSSSSPEAFGAIALSQPDEVPALAETLAHEAQHLKLNAILEIMPLTNTDDGRRFYAPWRDDPRPASGLLQGAYAYLGVCEFWRGQRQTAPGRAQLRAHTTFARWREAAALVTQTLLSREVLTPDGMRFCAGMARTLAAWLDEPVPPEALARARDAAGRHRAAWEARNGPASD